MDENLVSRLRQHGTVLQHLLHPIALLRSVERIAIKIGEFNGAKHKRTSNLSLDCFAEFSGVEKIEIFIAAGCSAGTVARLLIKLFFFVARNGGRSFTLLRIFLLKCRGLSLSGFLLLSLFSSLV
jgi:hypothetical protein